MITDHMTDTDRIEFLENLLKLEETTLASVTEQRDKLASALRGLISCIRETSGAAAHNALLNAVKAIAAVEGGNNE
jgi:hypothetical protein